MATGLINDPSLIRSYRSEINDAVENLRNQMRRTEDAISTVSQGWKDAQFQQFQENFGKDKELILPLCNVLETYRDDILYRLEENMNQYLCQSMIRLN